MWCLSNRTPVVRIRSFTTTTAKVPRGWGGGGELFGSDSGKAGNLISSVIKASPDPNSFPVCTFLYVCIYIFIYSSYFKASSNRKKVIEQ